MKRRFELCRGFTLVEVMIGSSLAAAVMAAVLSSFVFLSRNLARQANYHSLENKGREGLTYLRRDFALARAVKGGTAPTVSTLTLVLPAGDVTLTYDGAAGSLRRQATFGANRDFTLLASGYCSCTAFAFNYYTTTGGSPGTGGVNVPYSVKQIQVRFTPGDARGIFHRHAVHVRGGLVPLSGAKQATAGWDLKPCAAISTVKRAQSPWPRFVSPP